jgi:hypothetical protein
MLPAIAAASPGSGVDCTSGGTERLVVLVKPGSRAKIVASELRASIDPDFLNDFVRNRYFSEELAENIQVSGCLLRPSTTSSGGKA